MIIGFTEFSSDCNLRIPIMKLVYKENLLKTILNQDSRPRETSYQGLFVQCLKTESASVKSKQEKYGLLLAIKGPLTNDLFAAKLRF